LALKSAEFYGVHADSIWHWPPYNELLVFVDCNYPINMEMSIQEIISVDSFADGFILTPGVYDDFVMMCGFFNRGLDMTKFILDVDTKKKNRCQVMNSIQAFNLRGLVCSNFVADHPYGSQDLLSLFVQVFSL
jgi:hypothetical protein